MNMTDVATWGQLISSAAVLVTLIYLSIQTKQTAILLRSESRQSMLDADLQILSRYTERPTILSDHFSEGEISMESKIRLWSFLMAFMRTREHHWFQYQNGVLDHEAWTAYQTAILFELGTERTRTWWTTMGRQYYAPAFVETVDALIAEQQSSHDWYEQLLAWK